MSETDYEALFDRISQTSRIEARIAVLEANQINLVRDLNEIKSDLRETKTDSRTSVVRGGQTIVTIIVGFMGVIATLFLALRH